MVQSDLHRLPGLGLVVAVAVIGVFLVLRGGSRPRERHGPLLPGYPADLFPSQELARSGPLAALTATQRRLIGVYRHIPAHTDSAIWLHMFLGELREIMDMAYHVVVVTELYGSPAALDRIVADVQQIEQQIVTHIAWRLIERDGDAQHELLAGRMATLRLCVRELASMADPGPPAVDHPAPSKRS